jgi:hypothetical protein
MVRAKALNTRNPLDLAPAEAAVIATRTRRKVTRRSGTGDGVLRCAPYEEVFL